jgi:hypothetical protein
MDIHTVSTGTNVIPRFPPKLRHQVVAVAINPCPSAAQLLHQLEEFDRRISFHNLENGHA